MSFKKGDRVICIDDVPINTELTLTLVKGQEYVVNSVINCCTTRLDVGAVAISESPATWVCHYCKTPLADGVTNMPKYFNARRFRKVTEQVKVVKISIESEEPILN